MWTDKAEESFQTLKVKLTTTPVLVLPDTDKDFVVYCDASLQGLTVTWPDVWARMADRMFNPTSLVYSAYDRFINSNAVQVALSMVLIGLI